MHNHGEPAANAVGELIGDRIRRAVPRVQPPLPNAVGIAGEVKDTFHAPSIESPYSYGSRNFTYPKPLRRSSGQSTDGRAVMKTMLIRFAEDTSGATAIEYGLIAAIVGVGIIVGLTQLQGGLNTLFGNINTQLTK